MRRLACILGILLATPAVAQTLVPTPDHVVLVVMENHSYRQLRRAGDAPYIGELAERGADFINAFGVAHPSQPNYLALFSGGTHGVADNGRHDLAAPSLAGSLRAAGRGFVGYVESGSPRKHNPWESFADARGVERDFTTFPANPAALPTVSFVIPNLAHDMHDGSVAEGDAWLRRYLARYAEAAATSNNLLIVTFDEDDERSGNQIPTIFFGGPVKPGRYGERLDHYRVLRTIEAMYGLPPLGRSAAVPPITDVWK